MRRTLKCSLALLSPVLLTGCSSAFVVTADELCKDWRHQTVSKADKLTDATASGIEGSNDARVNWGCAPGQNTSKS
jgi:hypothetical protein